MATATAIHTQPSRQYRAKPLPAIELLRPSFRFDRESGRLYNLDRDASLFSTERAWKRWQTVYRGELADTCINNHGYRVTVFAGNRLLTHRVIWAIERGEIGVDDQIDHINGDSLDNRIENLRVVDHTANMRNRKLLATNSIGAHGVYWDARFSKWHVKIRHEDKIIFVGSFAELEPAIQARREAERFYGYHPNHGTR